jgi:hypothetical protein
LFEVVGADHAACLSMSRPSSGGSLGLAARPFVFTQYSSLYVFYNEIFVRSTSYVTR